MAIALRISVLSMISRSFLVVFRPNVFMSIVYLIFKKETTRKHKQPSTRPTRGFAYTTKAMAFAVCR